METAWVQLAVIVGGLILLPALCCALLRWAGFPHAGRAMIGGMIAGLLLGPGLFGRALPSEYETVIVGGVEQRIACDKLQSRHQTDLLAAEASRWSADQLATLRKQQADELAEPNRQHSDATSAHQTARRNFTIVMATITLLVAGAFAVPRSEHRQGIVAPISIGLWSAVIPGAVTYAVAVAWWNLSAIEAAWVASAISIGPWALSAIDRQAADDAELGGARLMQSSGRVASALAIAIALSAALYAPNAGWLSFALCLLALPFGWLPVVSRPVQAATKALRSAPPDGWFTSGLVASLTACIAINIDPLADFALWPIVVILLLCGDGRWLGAFIGAMSLGSRQSLRTMRLVLGAMAAGPTQLAVVAIGFSMTMIDSRLALALLLGAVLIEVATPTRRSFAQRLARAEDEITE